MLDFILSACLWTLALYGLLEIIKTIIYMCIHTNLRADGIYLIIAAKNQENKIEYFLRSILFKWLYGKEDCVKDIIITDLESEDGTKEIMKKLSADYGCVKSVGWKECKEIIDNVNDG